ncbi:hypothetical protein MHYP_G00216580 [Metynnis hypsauchen]
MKKPQQPSDMRQRRRSASGRLREHVALPARCLGAQFDGSDHVCVIVHQLLGIEEILLSALDILEQVTELVTLKKVLQHRHGESQMNVNASTGKYKCTTNLCRVGYRFLKQLTRFAPVVVICSRMRTVLGGSNCRYISPAA